MNTQDRQDRIDLLLQYTMAVACTLDFGRKELRPIHFIKYLYLADLEYARHHDGETFTGTPWRFHHFGPWAVEVFQRIEPALAAIGATKRTLENAQYGEYVQWVLDSCDLEERLKTKIDWSISTTIDQAVREFGSNTEELLHRVYTTEPMLLAAPEEALQFSPAPPRELKPKPTTAEPLTARQQKRFKEKVKVTREEVRRRLVAKKEVKSGAPKPRQPRYDEVFFQGLAALDEAAGEEIIEEQFTGKLSKEVWKSKARYDPDLS